MGKQVFAFAGVLLLLASCSGSNKKKEPPVVLEATDFTYTLSESTDGLLLWTTPPTHKLQENEGPPDQQLSGLTLSAAKNEFEPAQLILGPGSGDVQITADEFPTLGSNQRIELAVGGYTDGRLETLSAVENGGAASRDGSRSIPVWITVYVPPTAPAGEHETTVTLETEGGDTIQVPLNLYVFDFELPDTGHFKTQMNLSVSSIDVGGGDAESAKQWLFEHRMTPKNVSWPSGFGWNITWDNDASSDPCEILWDEPDEPDQYSIGWLSKRYILGEGWLGDGFPSSMLFQFVDNSTPRPSEFCGIQRGDQYGTSEYNTEWSQYLGALEQYLDDEGMIDKTYYYVQNEPQNDDDHQLAAHLCRLTKDAAPDLRIAISEEPKPEIAEYGSDPCGYDIWIAHVRAYQQNYAWERQRDFDEEVWLYSLDHDPDPYFNPTLVESDGMHQRIIPWVSWTLRATGWAYYDADRFLNGVRAEIFREGFEDYEYLFAANDLSGEGAYPQVFQSGVADVTAASVASSLTSWTRDVDAFMALRHKLGLYIEGTLEEPPVLESAGDGRPRGEYYINFQDPDGQPGADPLEVDGKTYMKIGWNPFDEELQYGWYGEFVEDSGIALYGYDDVSGYNPVESSYVYDDYGRDNLFEFVLENGKYEVTVGAGRPAHGYPGDPHNVTVEGQAVIDDEITTDSEPTITRTVTVDLIDGSLSVEMGGMSESSGNWAYTFFSFVEIVPVD